MGLPVPFYLILGGNFRTNHSHHDLPYPKYCLHHSSLVSFEPLTNSFLIYLAVTCSRPCFSFLFHNRLLKQMIYLLLTCELTWVGSPQSLMNPTAASWSKLSADV